MVRTPASAMDHYMNQSQLQPQQPTEINSKKRNMFLDLNLAKQPAKRGRFANIGGAPVLSSPDLHKLKLGSPDLEKILMGNGALTTATPTPNTASILFPRAVTEEQEIFASGFQAALSELQHSDSSQGGPHTGDMRCESTSSGDSSEDYSSLLENSQGATFSSSYGLSGVKEEQRVPSLGSSPPMSPINMESQEKIKLERKRQRNRVAASKCRKRKLERIAKLEDKVKGLKGENADLSSMVNKLKQQVCFLKEQVMEHVQHGCAIMAPTQFTLQ